mmetsp:Transcript_25064/g.40669  ORF Transcript_25064/g.40669 Transcript_25064/m.40669 type:complete len:346 (-) Transcript_25064:472-1509(-)
MEESAIAANENIVRVTIAYTHHIRRNIATNAGSNQFMDKRVVDRSAVFLEDIRQRHTIGDILDTTIVRSHRNAFICKRIDICAVIAQIGILPDIVEQVKHHQNTRIFSQIVALFKNHLRRECITAEQIEQYRFCIRIESPLNLNQTQSTATIDRITKRAFSYVYSKPGTDIQLNRLMNIVSVVFIVSTFALFIAALIIVIFERENLKQLQYIVSLVVELIDAHCFLSILTQLNRLWQIERTFPCLRRILATKRAAQKFLLLQWSFRSQLLIQSTQHSSLTLFTDQFQVFAIDIEISFGFFRFRSASESTHGARTLLLAELHIRAENRLIRLMLAPYDAYIVFIEI